MNIANGMQVSSGAHAQGNLYSMWLSKLLTDLLRLTVLHRDQSSVSRPVPYAFDRRLILHVALVRNMFDLV